MTVATRHPAVAGRFYPLNRDKLEADVRSYLSPPAQPIPALGCIVPHAGYVYSGHVAGAVYTRVEIPARCIVMCPNHTGIGTPLSIMSKGIWETPLGAVKVDSELGEALKQRLPQLAEDAAAHRDEHAIEVQLPFLQERRREFTFVPIAIGTSRFDALTALGDALADVIGAQADPVLIIASSDMNHYEDDAKTRVKDHRAMDRILTLDPSGLFNTVVNEDISMCGVGGTVAMLTAAKHLGATKAELIKYATSGDVSGDRDMVVGYAGIVVG